MDTRTGSESTLQSTTANTPKKNTTLPEIDMDEAKSRLSIIMEDIFQFNKRTGGRMSIHASTDGHLVVVASLPGHRLGVATTDSGRAITIDNEVVA